MSIAVETPANLDIVRHGDLGQLQEVLNSQRARGLDVVVSSKKLVWEGVRLLLEDMDPLLLESGVADPNGLYYPTSVADEGIATKLDIDLRYLRKMKREAPFLYAQNAQYWAERDDRKFLLRLFRSDDSHEGVLRAFLSDRFDLMLDNFDILLAALSGIREAGIEDPWIEADLTERRMVVRVTVPQISVLAPELLKNYRSPFDGTDVGRGWSPDRVRRAAQSEGHDPSSKVIFAGFVLSNSEVGQGSWRLHPRIEAEACTNGLVLTADGISKNHLGGKLDEGVIKWSEETVKANLALVTAQAKDTVQTFISTDYLTEQVRLLEQAAGVAIQRPQETIAIVTKKLGFTKEQANDILSHFIKGGQQTAGGIMQAITSVAQTMADGDVAFDMESCAVRSMTVAIAADKELVAA